VTFKDARDPKSIFVVDPNNLSIAFSSAVVIRSATIEITDAAVTRGIEDQLPWLRSVGDKYIDGSSTAAGSVGFHGGHFRK
jgi:hypothetical protein